MSRKRRLGDPWSHQLKVQEQIVGEPQSDQTINERYQKMENHIPEFTNQERQQITDAVQSSFKDNTFDWKDFLQFASTVRPDQKNPDYGQPTESEAFFGSTGYQVASWIGAIATIPLSLGASLALMGGQYALEEGIRAGQSAQERDKRSIISPEDQANMLALYALWRAKGWWTDGKVSNDYYRWVQTDLRQIKEEELRINAENRQLFAENQRIMNVWRQSLQSRTQDFENFKQTTLINPRRAGFSASKDVWAAEQKIQDEMAAYYRNLGQASGGRDIYDFLERALESNERIWFKKETTNKWVDAQQEFLMDYEKAVSDTLKGTDFEDRVFGGALRRNADGTYRIGDRSRSYSAAEVNQIWMTYVERYQPVWKESLTSALYRDSRGRIRSTNTNLDKRILATLYDESASYDYAYEAQLGVIASQNPSMRPVYAAELQRRRAEKDKAEAAGQLTLDDLRVLSTSSQFDEYTYQKQNPKDLEPLWKSVEGGYVNTIFGSRPTTISVPDIDTQAQRDLNLRTQASVDALNQQKEQRRQQATEQEVAQQTQRFSELQQQRQQAEAVKI